MTGIKVRLKCKYGYGAVNSAMAQNDIYIIIRLSFTLEYFKCGGRLEEGNVFVEID
jgi:hypothetical protein